jgi:glycosyltransferase involved in cell wall biosynthesis
LCERGINVYKLDRRRRGIFRVMIGAAYLAFRSDTDIYHFHGDGITNIFAIILYAFEAMSSKNSKYIVTHHSSNPHYGSVVSEKLVDIAKKIYHRHVFLYERQADKYNHKLTSKENVLVNNFPSDIFKVPTSNTKIRLGREVEILYVARFSEMKNQEFFVELVNYNKEANTDTYITVNLIGGGPTQKSIQHRIEKENINDRISVCGRKKPSTVRKYLDSADLFIHPSEYEAFPTTLLESISRGVPFISRHFDVFDNNRDIRKCGVILESMEPRRVHSIIQELIANDTRYKKMVKRCTEVSGRYSCEEATSSYLDIYEDVYHSDKGGGV